MEVLIDTKNIRILVLIILLAIFITASLSSAADYKYVGSVKSNKYHYSTCRWAKRIKSENMVTFESAKEALGAGYVPCKVCRPPGKDYN